MERQAFGSLIPEGWLVQALQDNQISAPTEVQRRALPIVFRGQSVIVQAQTGSGKTLVFGLPLLSHIRQSVLDLNITVGIVLTPTRELTLQIAQVLRNIYPDVDPVASIGGVEFSLQSKALKRDARIVVGTPGRVADLIRQGMIRLDDVSFFALDEADEMLSIGFLEEVETILERVPEGAQGIFTSATITPRVTMLASRFLKNPEQVCVEGQALGKGDVEHYCCRVTAGLVDKARRVIDVIAKVNPRSTIIFCNTKSDTEFVEAVLKRNGVMAERLNSDLTQVQRASLMVRLKDKSLRVVVATDLAARGLDVDQIDLVINYSLPDSAEVYVHRTGRTGRAGRSGIAATILPPMDIPRLHIMQKILNVSFRDYEDLGAFNLSST
jgi:ATP-dependent RNA helicase DeaD